MIKHAPIRSAFLASLIFLVFCTGRDHNTPPSRILVGQVEGHSGDVPFRLAVYGIKPTAIDAQFIVPAQGKTREVYTFERHPSYESGDNTPSLTVDRQGEAVTYVKFVTPKTEYTLIPGAGGKLLTGYAPTVQGVVSSVPFLSIAFPANDPAVAEKVGGALLHDADTFAKTFKAMTGA